MHHCFDEYVDNAAGIIGLSKEQTYEQLKAYYDGYRFHVDNATTVYSPWSVLNFLATPENGFRNYWYETGGSYPPLISSYIKSIQDTPLETLQKVRVSEDDLNLYYDYFSVPTVSLLYQTGYLTIKTEFNEEYAIQELFLVPPNLEVKSSLARLYLIKVRQNTLTPNQLSTAEALRTDFKSQDYNYLVRHFNLILNSFGYDNKVAFSDERNCRDFIELALTVAGISCRKEVISAQGRADLVVELPGTRYVFEFKLSRTESEEQKLLTEALSQLQDKAYGEILPVKELIKMAVVISAEKKAVSLWEIKPLS